MSAAVTYFDPQPSPAEVPAVVPSPFAPGPPHPLARRAADELVAGAARELSRVADLDAPGGGKMLGVLVVAARDGRIGYLCAFSGMVGERWHVDGFAPPVFDHPAREAFWPAGEAELGALEDQRHALAEAPGSVAARAALAEIIARHAAASDELAARHRRNRLERGAARERGDLDADARHALDQASRGDTAERRRLTAQHEAARAPAEAPIAALDAELAALEQRRVERSRELLGRILDTYVIVNARGERRPLRALFPDGAPPGGAADCAAPKLLAEAYRHGLRPLALAELWWGAPPATGDRRAGVYYPACRGKCGVVVPFMLDGLVHAAAPVFGRDAIADDEPRTVFEDEWLIVVDKPCGLLSVPGRSGALRDSVLTRLRRRFGEAAGPLVVHRLDLDTSGLLLAAKDPRTHAMLQRLFARREIDKRYVAWLAGDVHAEHGEVALPIRVDVDDRPRQVHDPVHGKPALTEWRVLARRAGQTRVALMPRTGRTHQLRVHAAHPLGLGAPIVGDRLYGEDGARLLLHAEALAFTHPHTGARLELSRPAPF